MVRRTVTVLAAATLMVLGGQQLAGAAFSDTTAATTAVRTIKVAPATSVRVDTSCTTTTRVIERTYRKNIYTGAFDQVGYSESWSTASSRSNVESDDTTTTWTSSTEYRTTRTIKDTELYATLRWKLSASPRVSGYRMTAHTTFGRLAMGETGPTSTSMTGQYDAEVVDYQARLSIDTLTDYGWTATSDLSNVVRC
jgi:hypothetical protein